MSAYSVIKDEIIYNEKENNIMGKVCLGEELISVSEKLAADNTKYSYVETYENENGIIIVGASSLLGLDKRQNIIPRYTKMGIWFYDTEFINNIDGIDSIISSIDIDEDPIKTLEQFNSDLYYEHHILPDLFTSALICAKDDYGNPGDNTSYVVEKQLSDGTRTNLSFRYQASTDFRTQLKKLYHSIIGVNGLSEEYLKKCGICDDLRPAENEIGMFDGNTFLKNLKKKIKTLDNQNEEHKKLVK